MKEILIIKREANSFEKYYSNAIKKYGVDCEATYKFENGIKDLICHIWMHFDLLGYSFFFGSWKKKIKQYETIIIFDWVYSHNIVRYIKKKNSDCRIIFWFWNKIEKNMKDKMLSDNSCEYWTFDSGDAYKYNLKQNIQFYLNKELKQQKNIENDVFFCGKDKGRVMELINLQKYFDKLGIRYDFSVVDDNTS